MLGPLLLALCVQDPVVHTGRLVDLAGEPVVGASVVLLSSTDSQRARSDAEGRFRLPWPETYARPRRLRVEGPSGLVREYHVGMSLDMQAKAEAHGLLRLAPGGTVVGRVVDREGCVLVEDQHVGIMAVAEGGYHLAYRQWTRVDVGTGEFRIEDVPPGPFELLLVDSTRHRRRLQPFNVESGVETFVEILGGEPAQLELHLRSASLGELRVPGVKLRGPLGRLFDPDEVKRGSARFVGLPAGDYCLSLPAGTPFEAPEHSLAYDAGLVTVDLLPLPGVELSLQVPGDVALPAKVRLRAYPEPGPPLLARRPRAIDLPDWHPLEGPARVPLSPGRWTLEVLARGWPSRLLEVNVGTDWTSVTVILARRRALRVRLSTGVGGAPLAGLPVELERGSGSARRVETSSTSDGGGRASLNWLALDPALVRVEWAPGLSSEQRVPVGTLDEIEMQAPPVGWVVGELVLPAGCDPDEWSIGPTGGQLRVPLGQGRFRLGPLRPGHAPIGLLGPEQHAVQLPTQLVVAGESTVLELDLRETLPARVSLELTGAGRGLGKIQVHLDRLGEGPRRRLMMRMKGGRAHRDDVPAGEYRVTLLGSGRSWRHELEQALIVKPGERRVVPVDLDLFERTVRFVVPASGKRGISAAVHHSSGSAVHVGGSSETREWTWVFPAGTVRFKNDNVPNGKAVEVQWGQGESVIVVTLPGN